LESAAPEEEEELNRGEGGAGGREMFLSGMKL